MVYSNILEAVGNTPVIQLNRMTGPDDARVLVKFEGMNAGSPAGRMSVSPLSSPANWEKERRYSPSSRIPGDHHHAGLRQS